MDEPTAQQPPVGLVDPMAAEVAGVDADDVEHAERLRIASGRLWRGTWLAVTILLFIALELAEGAARGWWLAGGLVALLIVIFVASPVASRRNRHAHIAVTREGTLSFGRDGRLSIGEVTDVRTHSSWLRRRWWRAQWWRDDVHVGVEHSVVELRCADGRHVAVSTRWPQQLTAAIQATQDR